MTFAKQQMATLGVGVVALTLCFGGLLILGRGVLMPFEAVWNVVLAVAAISFFVACGRWMHRGMWFAQIKHSTLTFGGHTYRDHFLRGVLAPFWTWWIWVDREGNDRG